MKLTGRKQTWIYRRVIQIIKAMLEAGIIGECEVNEEGVSQGSVLSPLLANACLDMLDEWISRQWELKVTRYPYKSRKIKFDLLKKNSKLIPGYIVRYADDFVIITDTREHAQSWKTRLCESLSKEMRLTLSPEKTLITDVRKQYIHFLGYEYKVVKGKARKGYLCRTLPDRKRLKRKVDAIAQYIKDIPHNASRERVVHEICLINSQIRGLVNYYQNCTWVNIAMEKHRSRLRLITMHWLKSYKGKWIPANKTQNLVRVHEHYKGKIPAIEYKGMFISVTCPTFVRWQLPRQKTQAETPFTAEGRDLYFQRTKKKRQNDRLDNMYNPRSTEQIPRDKWGKHFDFEFYMNRAYALNRDKPKCRVCGGWLISCTPYAHRINPHLPQNKVNKVNNLASMHRECMEAINNINTDLNHFEPKARRKIATFREKLVNSHAKTATQMERRVR